MATFASSEQAKLAAGDGEEERVPFKTESRRLNATGLTSLFDLRSEVIKKQANTVKTSLDGEYALKGKSSVLTVKKDEKEQKKREAAERKNKLIYLKRKIDKEEEEALEKSRQRLNEKARLYDKLASGTVFAHTDDSPVEFMVDFSQKANDTIGPKKAVPEHFIPNEEQRVYGTSHVILSQDEETRQKEITRIKNISKETEAAREKQKKQMDEKERLRLERSNRLRRANNLPEFKAPSPPPEVIPSVEDIPLPEDRPSDRQDVSFEEETQKRIRSDREWDRGKSRYTAWIEKQREERDDEFRPPEFY